MRYRLRLLGLTLLVGLIFGCAGLHSTWLGLSYSLSPWSEVQFETKKGSFYPPIVKLAPGIYVWITPVKTKKFGAIGSCEFRHDSLNMAFWNDSFLKLELSESYVMLEDETQMQPLSFLEKINQASEITLDGGDVVIQPSDTNTTDLIDEYVRLNKRPDAELVKASNRFGLQLGPTGYCGDKPFRMDLRFLSNSDSGHMVRVYFYPVVFTQLDR